MFKKIFIFAVLCGGGWFAYDYYKAGLYKRPDMPEGAFSLSFAGGFRGIMEGVPDERFTRRYRAHSPNDLPEYLKEAWAFCKPQDETWVDAYFAQRGRGRDPGEKFVGLCTIDVEGETVVRGVITSVPDL